MFQIDLEGVTDIHLPHRAQIVESLSEFRQEWEKNSKGTSLLDVHASVGLILYDIAECLGFSVQEKQALLGSNLAKQVDTFMEKPLLVKLPK